eukprot:gene1120-1455_t
MFWVMDTSLECPRGNVNTPQGRWAYGVAVPAIALTLGLPLLVLLLLSVPANRAKMNDQLFQTWFGFLYQGYAYDLAAAEGQQQPQPDGGRSWRQFAMLVKSWVVSVWDVVTHGTTVALTICSVYGMYGMHEYYQVLFLSGIFGTYLFAVLWLKPFKGITQPLQVFATAVLLATSLNILSFIPPMGLDRRQGKFAKQLAAHTGNFLVALNAAYITSVLVVLCRDWLLRSWRRLQWSAHRISAGLANTCSQVTHQFRPGLTAESAGLPDC